MKKSIFLSVLITVLVASISCVCTPAKTLNVDPNTVTVENDAEVTACFNAVNAFRTGSDAWYWDKDDKTKIDLSGKLAPLTLDPELCKAAQARAIEISISWGHTRPDGDSCFTVLSDLNYNWSGVGENIAAGSTTGSGAFNQWKEENANYNGQGHRRNILGDFTKIGIARYTAPGSTYGTYWAMILAK